VLGGRPDMRQMKLTLCIQKLKYLDAMRQNLHDDLVLEECFDLLWGIRTDVEVHSLFQRYADDQNKNHSTTVQEAFPRTIVLGEEETHESG
tara:strand:+ start:399 stop:671 length:273 start_codon:yes stop_codon:yes gene_type:complete